MQKERRLHEFSISDLYLVIGQNLPVGIFCFDNQQLVYCNQTFQTLFGIGEYQDFSLTSRFRTPKIIALLKSPPTAGLLMQDELILCEKADGSQFWCSVTLYGIYNNGKLIFSGSVLDRTAQIESENLLLKKNEDLKKLNQQLDRFLYSASHDVRQPLTSMMGLIRLMRMEKVPQSDADYLGKLETSVKKLDHFLSQIMEFSKNSHERVASEQINFENLFEAAIEKLESQITRKNISVSIHINSSNVFFSDPSRISLAIYHVLKNCVDYVDPSKSDSFVRLIATCYEDRTVIEVIDNGMGIAKMHLSKVTEMFYRGTDRSKGSGIGLYLVNEIVLKLEGRLSIDSELSLGTIVRIELPNGIKGALINRKKNLLSSAEPQKGLSRTTQ